jgi:hypothetical protein
MQSEKNRDDAFIELHKYQETDISIKHAHGNILKIHPNAAGMKESSENPQELSEDPEVVVHKSGDIIDTIEFHCSCGKKAEIHLQYDGD